MNEKETNELSNQVRVWLIGLLKLARYHLYDEDELLREEALAWLEGRKQEKTEDPVHIKVQGGTKGEMIKNSLITLIKDEGIKVFGGRFTKQDIIEWLEKK